MHYNDLSAKERQKIYDKIKYESPNSDIDIDDIHVEQVSKDYCKFSYKGMTLEIPIRKPDQESANNMWHTLAGGAVAIATVAVTLLTTKGR